MVPGLRVGGVAAFFSLCLRCSGVDTLATLLLPKLTSYVEKCMRQEAAYKSQCGETLAGALTAELVTVNYPLKDLRPRSVIATKYLDTSVAASTYR